MGMPVRIYTVVKGLGIARSVQAPANLQDLFGANAVGTIGRPDREAKNTIPSFVRRRGPRGPSGVSTTCLFAGKLNSSRMASAPARLLDPRTSPIPSIVSERARKEPSWCLLTKATVR
jgi:hypothetical protein